MNSTIHFLLHHGYTLLMAWVFAEQLGFPIPSMPILLSAGALAGAGRLGLLTSLFCVACASIGADLILYWMGRRNGSRVLSLVCRISLEPDSCVRRTRDFYSKQGARSLLFAKFVPGLNAVSAPLAGITRMKVGKFLLWDTMGALVWASVFLGTGYIFSHQIEDVAEILSRLGGRLSVLLALIVLGYAIYKYAARRKLLNQLRVSRVTVDELKHMLDEGEKPVILDLRNAHDFEAEPGTIPGAFHMNASDIGVNRDHFPQGREVILYCT